MLCEMCKTNQATVHLTEIIDGQRTESHLCQSCAQKEGVTIKNQLSLNELLSSLIAAHEQTEPQSAEGQTSCPYCGATMETFRKQALLGCPKDYEVFEKDLIPIIIKAQDGNLTHRGKIPANLPKYALQATEDEQLKLDRKNQIEELKRQLDKAVRDENYELAAKLRDQLKAMQQ